MSGVGEPSIGMTVRDLRRVLDRYEDDALVLLPFDLEPHRCYSGIFSHRRMTVGPVLNSTEEECWADESHVTGDDRELIRIGCLVLND